jgi:chemotaxis protein MotA
MIVIVGCLVVVGGVLGGFMMAGGHVGALFHPSEVVTIGGAALGALILMSPKKVLIDLLKGMVQSLKGSPYTKNAYEEMFKVTYNLFTVARKDGLIALESHVTDPHNSAIFNRYPGIAKNHHVVEFICGVLGPIIEGAAKPEQVAGMINGEVKLIEHHHHAPLSVLCKTADGLPGFGIVAAVLGIVVTMEAINGPVEEIGHKVGAALVGTFLGILASYGFFAPLATRMEFMGESEVSYFRTLGTIIEGFANSVPARVAIDQARRGVPGELRCSRERLDELFKEVDAG